MLQKNRILTMKIIFESLKNTMINTTDKGPEIFRQKLYQVGIEPNIINTYVPIYEEEQSFEAVIEVAKNYEN